jgi:hypothetical protein
VKISFFFIDGQCLISSAQPSPVAHFFLNADFGST